MKRKGKKYLAISALLIGLFMIFQSCDGRKKYVSARTVEIEIWGDLEEGDWITIDDLKFVHVSNDTTDECDILYDHNDMAVNEKNQSEDHYFLPSTTYYTCVVEGKMVPTKLSEGSMAFSILSALDTYGIDGNAYLYKNGSSTLEVTFGKIRLTRTDNEKIKVSTSDNYKAAVRAIKEE